MTLTRPRSIFLADGTVRHWLAPAGTALNQPCRVEQHVGELFAAWLQLAQLAPVLADAAAAAAPSEPALTAATKYLLETTGLSHRQLAALIGTTHPTVASILRGHQPVRVDGLMEAIVQIQSVVDRLLRMTSGDKSLLRLALHAQGDNEMSGLDLLKERQYSRAYLAAIDFINQHKRINPYKQVNKAPYGQRQPGRETVSLRDADDE